jgi:hypothetical protein
MRFGGSRDYLIAALPDFADEMTLRRRGVLFRSRMVTPGKVPPPVVSVRVVAGCMTRRGQGQPARCFPARPQAAAGTMALTSLFAADCCCAGYAPSVVPHR